MEKMALIYFSCVLFLSVCVDAALKCYDSGYSGSNKSYMRNRNQIVSSLGTNVTANGGFHNASLGQDSNRAYALGLCREGYKTEDCLRCVNWVGQNLIKLCGDAAEAYSWDDNNDSDTVLCLVRYSNRYFFGSLQLRPLDHSFSNSQLNLPEFDQIWVGLMNRMIAEASAGNSSCTLKYYAVAKQSLGDSHYIYALMQCTPDISPAECNTCLQKCLAYFQGINFGKRGGEVATPSCLFRWDMQDFYGAFDNTTSLPLPPQTSTSNQSKKVEERRSLSSETVITIVTPTVVNIMIFAALIYACCRLKKQHHQFEMAAESDTQYMLKFDLDTLRTATDNFSMENKLGQGGFGAVYKGKLPNGQDVAVKRLIKNSGQGDREFKNEVLLLARLQHRNLVKLLGFCYDEDEKLLVYEFVPNSSLDGMIFDPARRLLLAWDLRYKIIEGIVRGLLYLHEDSQLRIIHRDLKTSNILLDAEINPKISDFGLARLFSMDETRGQTSRVVGTYGYMAPEYMRHGQFSIKSDVYSFGVMVLEIITGKKNSSFQAEGLPAYAWKGWAEGRVLDILDPIVRDGAGDEIIRCIHIALLCVQEHVERRPTMNSVVLWLGSPSTCLPLPTTPAFIIHSTSDSQASSSLLYRSGTSNQYGSELGPNSFNNVSLSEVDPR